MIVGRAVQRVGSRCIGQERVVATWSPTILRDAIPSPDTTPVGAEYRSTDGAGAGLFDWMKRPTGWVNTGGGSGIEQVSGNVTLDGTGAPIRAVAWLDG